MKLVLALAHAGSIDELLRVFANAGIPATQIVGDTTVGRQHFAAVIAGVEDANLAGVLRVIRALGNQRSSCGKVEDQPKEIRTESQSGAHDQEPNEVVVYVLPVRRFERIGYA